MKSIVLKFILGEPPLADLHPMRALVSIPRNPPPSLRQSQEWSKEFNDFIRQCLIKDFEARPTVANMLTHPFINQIPVDGIEARRRIVQFVHRYKRCYDLSGRKSRETCGVKNGRIRGKSETCSSTVIDTVGTPMHPYSPNVESIAPPPPPPKRIIQVMDRSHHPSQQINENPKRMAPPPPPPPSFTLENGDIQNDPNKRIQPQQNQVYKTKRRSQSRQQQKQLQIIQVKECIRIESKTFLLVFSKMVMHLQKCSRISMHRRITKRPLVLLH